MRCHLNSCKGRHRHLLRQKKRGRAMPGRENCICKSNEPGLQMSYRYSGNGECDLRGGLGGRGRGYESLSLASVLICAQ